jgi:HlyD family secretion protein
VLARLARETLDAQMVQSRAAQAKAEAVIAQTKSQISQWEALLAQKAAAFARANELRKQGVSTEAAYDAAQADYRTTQANLAAGRDGLRVAEAEVAAILAQRQELEVRIAHTEVRAPEGGIVSRRSARMGAVAAGAGDAMFRIIAKAEVELEAEVPELKLAKLRPGQPATVTIGDVATLGGKVRLVSPEVEKASRLGKVRVAVDKSDVLRIGAFARGEIEVSRRSVVALPLAAVLYDNRGAYAQGVRDGVVYAAPIKTGLVADGLIEIVSGVFEDETIIAKAGSFLHDGDKVRVVFQTPKPAPMKVGPQAQADAKPQAENN